MNAKAQVIMWATFLIVLGSALILYKHFTMSIPLTPGKQTDVWVIESLIKFEAEDKPVKAVFSLPGYFGHFEVLDENSASEGYGFARVGEGRDRQAIWSKRMAQGLQKIYYNFTIYDMNVMKKTSAEPLDFEIPVFSDSKQTAVDEVVNAAWAKSADISGFIREIVRRLDENSTQNANLLKKMIKEEYSFLHLVRDLLRYKGIGSAVVYGLKLEDGARKVSPDQYLGVYDEHWWVVDLSTGEYTIPEDVIFWGAGATLNVEGGKHEKVRFSMMKSRQSAKALSIRNNLDEASPLINFSIYALPLEFQAIFKGLLLIPVGCFIVVLLRNLVGMPTSGTFMPVLLSLAFIDTGLSKGLIVLLVILTLGLLVRNYLSHMNLLLVPRISAVVISVVLLMAFISVLSFKLGLVDGISVTLFPMIIISWTIERASVLWEEHGGVEVFKQMGGSLVASILIYFAMTNSFVKYFTFTYPEAMIVLLGLILFIGIYTGYRLTELYRFEPLVKEDK
jgi:hypothetical protein